jgi:hypothetical protein
MKKSLTSRNKPFHCYSSFRMTNHYRLKRYLLNPFQKNMFNQILLHYPSRSLFIFKSQKRNTIVINFCKLVRTLFYPIKASHPFISEEKEWVNCYLCKRTVYLSYYFFGNHFARSECDSY